MCLAYDARQLDILSSSTSATIIDNNNCVDCIAPPLSSKRLQVSILPTAKSRSRIRAPSPVSINSSSAAFLAYRSDRFCPYDGISHSAADFKKRRVSSICRRVFYDEMLYASLFPRAREDTCRTRSPEDPRGLARTYSLSTGNCCRTAKLISQQRMSLILQRYD